MQIVVVAFSKPLRFEGPLCTHPAAGGGGMGRGSPLAGSELQGSLRDLQSLRGTLGCAWLACAPCAPTRDRPVTAPTTAPECWRGSAKNSQMGSTPQKHEKSSFHLVPSVFSASQERVSWQEPCPRSPRLENPVPTALRTGKHQTRESLGQTGKHNFLC